MEPDSRILFVDDEEGVRDSWHRYLTDYGHTVTTADDGESAILRLQSEPVEVVISDLRMRGKGGIEVLQWLHDHQPRTRFILITGYGSEDVERQAQELGAYAYLEKPVRPERLLAVAEAALRATPSPTAAIPAVPEEQAVVAPTVPTPARQPVASSGTRGGLKSLGLLVAAPVIGGAFVLFLPLIGLGFAAYAIGLKMAKVTGLAR